MKKRIISLLLAFCMVIALVPATALADEGSGSAETAAGQTGTAGTAAKPENPFADVAGGSWYEAAVLYACANGFFQGTSATTFEPEGPMTRAMFVTVLGRMAGVKAANYAGAPDFSDVAEGIWYAPFVKWAAQYGITAGTGDGKFSPNDPITREELAVFFVRYFEIFGAMPETDTAVTTKPADLDEAAPWAQDAVLRLWSLGLLNGDGERFMPGDNTTRAQVAALCERTDRAVGTWYSEPGVPSERVSVDPAAQTPEEDKKPSDGGTTTENYCEVTFRLGDGVDAAGVTLPQTKTYVQGTRISELPTPTKPGAIFLGWFYDAALTEGAQTDDTVTRNLTLYAKMAAGEEVQSVETPNYVTKTDVAAGTFTFVVTGVAAITESGDGRTLEFINVTGSNMEMAYTVSGSADDGFTVSAELEAGQTYRVELLDSAAEFKLDGVEQGESVRILNVLTAKAEVKNAQLSGDVKQIDASATEGLADAVFQGLYQIDNSGLAVQNTASGRFTYKGGTLSLGDVLAVKSGDGVDLSDPSSTAGDVAYIKITGILEDGQYSYEMADVDDVLMLPDVLPIERGWDKDNSDKTVTITADDLSTALKNVDADSLDVGDFLSFINGTYGDEADAVGYGRVTGFTQDGDDCVITYVSASEAEIEAVLDVYYTQEKPIEVTEADIARIENALRGSVGQSSYPAEAAAYLMAVMAVSDGLDEAPDPAAVAAYQETITASTAAEGGIALYADDGSKASAEVDWKNFRVYIDSSPEHLQGRGFDIQVIVPITLEMGDVSIEFSATFEEEVILSQNISTKRHKIGFLRYDYSLNSSFNVGNYTGISFEAKVQSGGEDDPSMSEKLDEIFETLDTMKEYGEILKDEFNRDDGGSGSDGTVESISELYQEVMESASDAWVEIINVSLFDTSGSAFLHIFCWQIKGSFVVSANMAVAMGLNFEYSTQKQYNFSVRVKSHETTNQTIDIITPQYTFDFYVIGTIGIRAGLRLEMYVGLFSLKVDKVGIVAEVGVYTQLYGYFFYHLEWKQGTQKKSSSAGALFIEIGMYLDIKFVAQLFSSKLTWAPTIYANEWPLWSAGDQQNVFGFVNTDDTEYAFQSVKTMTLPSSTYAVRSMDLKTGKIADRSMDTADAGTEEKYFRISFSNPKFSYDAATNTVTVTPGSSVKEETDMTITWRKAALAFTSTPIQKVLHIEWSDPANMRTISFDSCGGSAVKPITLAPGSALTPPENPTRAGYTFVHWGRISIDPAGTKYVFPDTMPDKFTVNGSQSNSITLYAYWRANNDTPFTVNHYQKQLDGKYKLVDTVTLTGTTGYNIRRYYDSQVLKTYTGFWPGRYDNANIAADGSTVVNVYYDRKGYEMKWMLNYDDGRYISRTRGYEAKIYAPDVTREGYEFAGWYWDEDCTDGPIDFGENGPTVNGHKTFYAKWQGVPNTISFDSNSGSAVENATGITGETFNAPDEPSRIGYTFAGWFSDPDCTRKWDFDHDTVPGAMTLYAKWTAKRYTVTFEANGGTVEPGSKTVTYDEAYGELPAPTRAGYDFAGWFTAQTDGTQVRADDKVAITADQTLYARWTEGETTYTVKHLWQNIADDEYTVHETETVSGTTNGTTAAAARSYEGFAAQAVTQQTIAADGSTVIEIKYDRNKHTVTWMNGETELKTETVKYGATPVYSGAKPEQTETGHTFTLIGWNTAADGKGMALTKETTVTDDVIWYAQFRDTLNTYKITYENVNGAENNNPASYTYSTAVTLTDLSRTGYTFGGWFDNASCTGNAVTEISAAETGNKTFYAKWTANEYTVTLVLNGGSLVYENGSKTLQVTFDAPYGTLPTVKKSGYVLQGWYLSEEGTDKVDDKTTVTTAADHKLYARWVEDNTVYPLWVGTTQITAKNADILFGSSASHYNADTNTLTLHTHNVNSKGGEGTPLDSMSNSSSAYIRYEGTEPLTIHFIGSNYIVNTSTAQRCYGIYVTNADLTLECEFDQTPVTISSGPAPADSTDIMNCGIYVNGNLTIKKGEFTVKTPDMVLGEDETDGVYQGFGIWVQGSMTVEDGATLLSSVGNSSGSYAVKTGLERVIMIGLRVEGDLVIDAGSKGSVTAQTGFCTPYHSSATLAATGISSANVTVNSGSLASYPYAKGAYGKTPESRSCVGLGMGATGTLTVNGGSVRILAGSSATSLRDTSDWAFGANNKVVLNNGITAVVKSTDGGEEAYTESTKLANYYYFETKQATS